MMIVHIKNNVDLCPKGVSLMGLDVGQKTIGVAVCDDGQIIATPVKTIKRHKLSKDVLEIARIAREYDVGGFVLGYPLNMDGSEGVRCQSIRDFALEFVRQYPVDDVWIGFWDERLSTATVEEYVDKYVEYSKRRAKDSGLIDKLAAQAILQWAIDYIGQR